MILDIGAALWLLRQPVVVVLAQTEIFRAYAVARVPAEALVDPALVPLFIGPRHNEKLDLHLLELARAESEIARSDLVAKRLAALDDAEGQLHAHGLRHVIEVDENSLRRLPAHIGDRPLI